MTAGTNREEVVYVNIERGHAVEASDKKQGMTFAELRQFVSEGMRYDVADDTKVECWVGFRSQIQKVQVRWKSQL